MKGLVITSKGIEKYASTEIKELTDGKCEIQDSCVVFECKSFEDLCMLCYKSQSADRVMYLIDNFEFKDFFNDLENAIGKLELIKWIIKNKKFKVECVRHGNHNFKSVDVEKEFAMLISSKYKNKITLDIKDYDIIFLVYIINDNCYIGIDFAGFELNKRPYKIFLHPSSLRGTIAYALIRESGFEKNDIILDPFSRDGIVAIETAFFATGFPCNYFKKDRFAFLKLDIGVDFEKFFRNTDKKIAKKIKAEIYAFDHLFKYVDYSKKNAKIAGVDKEINFSRVELEWLDIKFKKESVDKIITNLPISKNANLDKIYNEFFYQSEYILKKNGTIGLIARMPDLVKKHASSHNFDVFKEKDLWSGEQKLAILILKKKNI